MKSHASYEVGIPSAKCRLHVLKCHCLRFIISRLCTSMLDPWACAPCSVRYLPRFSSLFYNSTLVNNKFYYNKANPRDLIAATGLVILLKLDSNRWFFARVTLKFDGWPRKIKRHVFNTTGVTVQKRPIWVKFDDFLAMWPCNMTYDLEKQ